jgi:oxygen-independent coproporphyrinogen III oxidase
VSLGIYLHIPFCQAKCDYCHFISVPMEMELVNRYTKAVISELRTFTSSVAVEDVNSIYLGGGTPSLIPEGFIEAILEACRQRFTLSADCEVSLEANPGTVSATKATAFHQAGITRISMGAQSFEDQELVAVGRLHSAAMISESLTQLRHSGFANINLDLMLGLPQQTKDSWRRNLTAITQLAIPHISVYMLDLEGATRLLSRVLEGSVVLPDDDCICDLYIETLQFLSLRGYAQYEISNFAQPGYFCRHNLKYWKREPVLGFGAGSHSFDGQYRYANSGSIEEYCRLMEAGVSPMIWRESITAAQALQESLFLGLRLTEGVDWNCLQDMNSGEPLKSYENSLEELCSKGLIERNGSNFRLTIQGMLLSNEVFQAFV